MGEARFKVGPRVNDVDAAADFYAELGFDDVGSVADPGGRTVMTILDRGGVLLIAAAIEGMPFPDTARERQVTSGPRGLGVAIGLAVDDLDEVLQHCKAAGCTITSEPMDAEWGERVFECIDPFGYQWKMSQPRGDTAPADGLAAVRESWFGGP